jgi:hypothetical protein
MRAFVQMRRMLESHKEVARKVNALERTYDAQCRVVFDAIRALMQPPKPASTDRIMTRPGEDLVRNRTGYITAIPSRKNSRQWKNRVYGSP